MVSYMRDSTVLVEGGLKSNKLFINFFVGKQFVSDKKKCKHPAYDIVSGNSSMIFDNNYQYRFQKQMIIWYKKLRNTL